MQNNTSFSRGPRSTGGRSSAPARKSFSSSNSRPSSAPARGGFSSRPPMRGGFKSGGSRGPSRFSGTRNGGGSRGGGGRGGFRSEKLDFSRFVNKVTVTEQMERFEPKHKFTDFQIDETLKKTITDKGYVLPTPIQDQSIPHVLAGHDVVGIANTGTGKTAAFLIPLVHKVLKNRKEQVIIIVPTRELAVQIDQELQQLVRGMKIFSVVCIGGAPMGKQLSQLRYQNNFIIGTPGRLNDFVDRRAIVLADFGTIVLDEADRMLDMGFVADMRAIMAAMPKDHQTLFFSATISPEIERLIGEFLREPVRISVRTQDTSKNVEQDIVRVPRGQNKMDVLHDLLNQKELTKVLVFGRTKHGVEKLSRDLVAKGFKAESIHGDKNHSRRQMALKLFKEDRVQILVATDVAARGLDIADVSHVINYDVPATKDDYIHRIGRTGRGNKKGKALTFID